jgi:hypothetical protein
MAEALNIPFLHKISNVFIYIALFAWISAFIGMMRSFLSELHKLKNRIKQENVHRAYGI